MKQERAFTVGRRFDSFRSDYAQEIRNAPEQVLISQDCAYGLRDAASSSLSSLCMVQLDCTRARKMREMIVRVGLHKLCPLAKR